MIFFVIFFSCKTKVKVLPINKMKVVMWDITSADEWMKISNSKDSTQLLKKQNISLYNKIFALHQTTKEEFYNSYNYYQNNPNEMKALLDSLMNYGTKKRDTIVNHIGK
jgi:hypothetical protein